MLVVDYKSELNWLIDEFCKKSEEAKKRVAEFKKGNRIPSLKDCKDVKVLEHVLRAEIHAKKKKAAGS